MNVHSETMNRKLHLPRLMGLFISMILLITPFLNPGGNIHVQARDGNAKITELENKVLQSFDHASWLSTISTDAVEMYFLWPGIDGLLNLYEATGKTEYVGYAIEYCQRYQSMGQDINGDGYLDWYSSWIEAYSHHHVEWRAGDGVARTVALVLTDPSLSSYVNEARELQEFLRKHIWEKWTGGYNIGGTYTTVTHFIGRFGLIALSLYQITGEQQYLSYIQTKGNQLKQSLILNAQDAYWWQVYTDSGGAVDVSHGGDTVNFMVEAYRLGLVFTETDINRLINTVKKNLWDGSLTSPQFREYVDGSGNNGGVGDNQGGWIKLAQFDPELQEIYYNWLKDRNASSQLGVHFHGNLARSIYLSQSFADGDIDQNSVIDQLDLKLAVDIFLERNSDPIFARRADLNGDGAVNAIDIQQIIEKIMGQSGT
jgi:hypothetical protein